MAQRDRIIGFSDLEDGSNIYAADFGEAIGVSYAVDEELRIFDKEHERDVHRWELNPASAEDYGARRYERLRSSV